MTHIYSVVNQTNKKHIALINPLSRVWGALASTIVYTIGSSVNKNMNYPVVKSG